MEPEEFGRRMRKIRRRKGETLQEVANEVGVTKVTVSRWERNGPPEGRWDAIADALEVPVDELTGEAEGGATPKLTRIVASADAEERWVEAVRNSDLDREMKMMLVYLTGQSVLNRQHWVASVDPESLAETVNEDVAWVREKWEDMLATDFVEQIEPGPHALRLVIPEE